MKNCKPYPNCIVVSYQWYVNEDGCPCATYINRKTDPRTYAEWIDPLDVTKELSLVKEGQLKTIQLINRALPTFPDAMRNCKKLEQIILLYTKTEVIPDWAEELNHIEGDFTGRSLTYMPPNLCFHMKKLRFIRTGIVLKLGSYPSLKGLRKLQYLAIAAPYSMTEPPSLDGATSLISLAIVDAHYIQRLPSFHASKKLRSFGFFYRCKTRSNETEVVCLGGRIPDADLALIKGQTMGLVCSNFTEDLMDIAPSQQTTDVACDGVMYRQCQVGGAPGICFNGRMQVVYCDPASYFEQMRRLQIARNVGEPCDSEVEAWLGCTGTSSQ